jgi:hypothetical protein
MANTPNTQQPGADAPDLGPEPGDTITMPREELTAMIAEQVAEQVAELTKGQGARASRPTSAKRGPVPTNRHSAPSEPTWEPPFIPTAEDFAAANAAASKGQLVDEPIAVGGTIIAVDANGEEHVVTPKAYRHLYKRLGWVANDEDARRGLAGQGTRKRRRRGGGNLTTDDEHDTEQATAPSRRRRRRD